MAGALEPGAAVALHLPPEGLRVLTPSEPAEETEEATPADETVDTRA
jgi:hypothetical protein